MGKAHAESYNQVKAIAIQKQPAVPTNLEGATVAKSHRIRFGTMKFIFNNRNLGAYFL
jgi:hypothetical protein